MMSLSRLELSKPFKRLSYHCRQQCTARPVKLYSIFIIKSIPKLQCLFPELLPEIRKPAELHKKLWDTDTLSICTENIYILVNSKPVSERNNIAATW